MSSNLDRASTAWGEAMPDWIRIFSLACDDSSQKKVADQLGYSPTVINQVLSNKYPGDLAAVKQAVEGRLMSYTVTCPVLDEIRADICLQHQKRKFAATNKTRINLFKACRGGCPHSRIGK